MSEKRSRILEFDEPDSGLAKAEVEAAKKEIIEMINKGQTVVVGVMNEDGLIDVAWCGVGMKLRMITLSLIEKVVIKLL